MSHDPGRERHMVYRDVPDRHWNTEAQQWVYEGELNEALDAAQLAIDEYYNGDRTWAEQWLLKAYEANRETKK